MLVCGIGGHIRPRGTGVAHERRDGRGRYDLIVKGSSGRRARGCRAVRGRLKWIDLHAVLPEATYQAGVADRVLENVARRRVDVGLIVVGLVSERDDVLIGFAAVGHRASEARHSGHAPASHL